MRRGLYLALTAIALLVTAYFIWGQSAPMQMVKETAKNAVKTVVVVYQGEVAVSEFDKKGTRKPAKILKEGQTLVVTDKKAVDAKEGGKIASVLKSSFPKIFEAMSVNAKAWANSLPQGQSVHLINGQAVANSLNKKFSQGSALSGFTVTITEQGMSGFANLKMGFVNIPLVSSGTAYIDPSTREIILKLNEIRAGVVALPEFILRDLERSFMDMVIADLPVNISNIEMTDGNIRVTCVKDSRFFTEKVS